MKRSAVAKWFTAAAIIVMAGDPLYWEVNAQDAASAASCSWHLREGGTQVTPSLTDVTCVIIPGLSDIFTCHAPLPAVLAVGNHTLTLTEVCGSGTTESDASNALAITIALPKANQPRNLRTTPGE